MAWRVNRFGIRHSLRDRGVANVSQENAIASGDYEAFLLDERREVMSFAGAETDHHVQVDLGTGYASITVDRVIVPAGHNFDGYDFRIRESSTSDFSADIVQLLLEEPHSGTGQIDEALDQESTKRYIRVDWITDSFAPDIPEIWLTKTLTTSQGPNPVTWRDTFRHNVQTWVTPAGDRGDVQQGASQRYFELDYRNVNVAADIAILDQLIEDVGMDRAFIFDPPFDDEAALICKMDRPPEREFDYRAPQSGTKGYRYRFSIIEQLV